jgi:hypothetical protein
LAWRNPSAGGVVEYTPKLCLSTWPPFAVTRPTEPASSRSAPTIEAMAWPTGLFHGPPANPSPP